MKSMVSIGIGVDSQKIFRDLTDKELDALEFD